MRRLISILLFVSIPTLAVVPTNESNLADEIQVQQEKKDRKVWRNMLAIYKNTRDIANGSLDFMQSVSDFALAGSKFLASIDNITQRVERIWVNIRAFSAFFDFNDDRSWWENVKHGFRDAVGVVEHAWEGVYAQADDLFYRHVPTFKNSREDLRTARLNIVASGGNFKDAVLLKNLRDSTLNKSKQKYVMLAQESAADKRVYESKSGTAKRYMLAQNVAINAMASAETRNLEIDIETIPTSILMANAADSSGDQYAKAVVEDIQTLSQNRFVGELRSIETQQQTVGIIGQILLSKLVSVDNVIYQSAAQVYVFEKFSDELIKQQQADWRK